MSKFQFALLVPELSCISLESSLAFYIDLIDFKVSYDRPENQFAYLSLGSAQIMLEQINHNWSTGVLERPFGRGINFQMQEPSRKG